MNSHDRVGRSKAPRDTTANGGPKERGEGGGGGRHVRELRKERGFVHVFELERWFFSMEKDIWHAMVCLRQ